MKASTYGIKFIASHEGERLAAYQCPAGVWTIGFGHTGKDVHEGLTITHERALELLTIDVQPCENFINSQKLDLNQNQFDALVSFAFNCGIGNLKNSTLLKCVRSKLDNNIKKEFAKWNKASGKALPGLTKRRLDETILYFTQI